MNPYARPAQAGKRHAADAPGYGDRRGGRFRHGAEPPDAGGLRRGRGSAGESRPEGSAGTKVTPWTVKANKKSAKVVEKSAAAYRAAANRARPGPTADGHLARERYRNAVASRVGKAKAEPGSLPLTLAAPRAVKGKKQPRTADAVKVEVLGQKATKKLGIKGVVLKVTGPKSGGRAQLGIDYSAFATAYGGDWAGRLQLLKFPDCLLDTADKGKCRTSQPLDSANDRGGELLSSTLTFKSTPVHWRNDGAGFGRRNAVGHRRLQGHPAVGLLHLGGGRPPARSPGPTASHTAGRGWPSPALSCPTTPAASTDAPPPPTTRAARSVRASTYLVLHRAQLRLLRRRRPGRQVRPVLEVRQRPAGPERQGNRLVKDDTRRVAAEERRRLQGRPAPPGPTTATTTASTGPSSPATAPSTSSA